MLGACDKLGWLARANSRYTGTPYLRERLWGSLKTIRPGM